MDTEYSQLPDHIDTVANLARRCVNLSRLLQDHFKAIQADAEGNAGGSELVNGERIRRYTSLTTELRDTTKDLVRELVRRDLCRLGSTPILLPEDG